MASNRHENDEDQVPEKVRELRELFAFVKENYPTIAPMVQGRVNHFKRRMVYVAAAVGGVCEIVQLVLG